jgi:hypothetical protein
MTLKKCQEKGRVARRIGQETEVLLLYMQPHWLGKSLCHGQYFLFSCIQHGDWRAIYILFARSREEL